MTLKRPRPTLVDLSPRTELRSCSGSDNCIKDEKAIDISDGDDADDDLLMKLNLMWGQLLKQNERQDLAALMARNVAKIEKLQQLQMEADGVGGVRNCLKQF